MTPPHLGPKTTVFLGSKTAFSSYGGQRLLSSFGARAFRCGGFCCCRAQARARGLQWFLSVSSVAVVHGLSCPMARGIFLEQGSNLCPLHWQEDS